MNLLQIKQKMEELAISERYMADACGVSELYFRQVFNLSKPVTNALMKKIEGVINTYQIGKAVAIKKKTIMLDGQLKDLYNKKKQLGCSWKVVAANTASKYNPDYLQSVVTGKYPLTEKIKKEILEAFDKIENGEKEELVKDEKLNNDVPVTFVTKNYEVNVEDLPESVEVIPMFKKKEQDSKELIRGRILGIKKARMAVKEVISDEAFTRRELIDILFKLDNELDLLVDSILAEV